MRDPFRQPAPPPSGKPPSALPDTPARPSAPAPVVAGSAVLPRNFTVTTEERVRAIVTGVPAYVRRKRRMEDLEGELVIDVARLEGRAAPDDDAPFDAEVLELDVQARVEQLNRLVEAHNRYYPVEANLPTDVRTGVYLEMGEPWSPRPRVTVESLRRRVRGGAV
jgi:hypothetical protein